MPSVSLGKGNVGRMLPVASACAPRAALEVIALDLADLASVRRFAHEYRAVGDYFGPDGFLGIRGYPTRAKAPRRVHDESVARRLWDASEELIGVRYDARDGGASPVAG